MELLPDDVWREIFEKTVQSTRLAYSLVCKRFYMLFGASNVSIMKAIEYATFDDNPRLLQELVKRLCVKTMRKCYHYTIFPTALRGNARGVLTWYLRKKLKASECTVMCNIEFLEIETVDLLYTKKVIVDSHRLIICAIGHDMVKIFQKYFLDCGSVPTADHIKLILEHGALGCLLAIPTQFWAPLRDMIRYSLKNGTEKMVSYFLDSYCKEEDRILALGMMRRPLLENDKINSVDLIPPPYTTDEINMILVRKSTDFITKAMEDVEIKEEHCHIILQRCIIKNWVSDNDKDVLQHIFSRFEGTITLQEDEYRYNGWYELDNIISKVTNTSCLSELIFRQEKVEYIALLAAKQGGLTERDFIFLCDHPSLEMLRECMKHTPFPQHLQINFYKNYYMSRDKSSLIEFFASQQGLSHAMHKEVKRLEYNKKRKTQPRKTQKTATDEETQPRKKRRLQ